MLTPETGSWFSSLRFRLLVIVLLAVLPAVVLILINASDRRAADLRGERETLGRLSRIAAEQEREGFSQARQLLTTLAELEIVRRTEAEACGVLLARILKQNPRYANLGLVNADGKIVASGLPMAEPLEAGSRTWYRRAVATGRLSVGDFQVGRITGRPSIHLALPMLDDAGGVRGVLFAAFDLSSQFRDLDSVGVPEGFVNYVMDSKGIVLARVPGGGADIGRPFHAPEIFDQARGSPPMTTELDDVDGTRRLFAFTAVEVFEGSDPIYVAVGSSRAAALSGANRMLAANFAGLAVVALLAIGAWMLGDRFLVHRTRSLVRVVRQLGSGNLEARAPRPYDRGELGQLERAFDAMAESLQRRNASLLESAERFRGIAETIQEAFWIVSPNLDRVEYVSPAFEQIWGRQRTEVQQRPALLVETVHPDDRARVTAAYATMASGGFHEEYRILRPDRSTRWILSHAFPVRGDDGLVERIIGVSEDRTERKRLEEQFLQSQKMDALGRLAGGVAHDFNNLLTIISGYGEILLTNPALDDESRTQLREIVASSQRASSLTRQLLAFSRKQVVQVEPLDLNDVMARMENMLRRIIGENIRLVPSPAKDLGRVLGDPGQIEQVILNLVVNARDAMPRGGTVHLETGNVELDEAYARTHEGVKPGPYVMVAVSDTGIGMDAATQARVFEPFFTTKEKGQGTGLGLSTVYGIVKQSGGHIWLYSEPGKGTSFKIFFPQTERATEAGPARRTGAAPAGGTETILLVEDEANLRNLIRGVLQNRGYTVLEAADGVEAERVSDTFPGPIHLLVTDSVLPHQSGPALSKVLIARREDMRVLFMSGYTEHSVFDQAGVEMGRAFLQKPFAIEALVRKVREVLEAAPK
jgi:PAS domain S-box-containing protein